MAFATEIGASAGVNFVARGQGNCLLDEIYLPLLASIKVLPAYQHLQLIKSATLTIARS